MVGGGRFVIGPDGGSGAGSEGADAHVQGIEGAVVSLLQQMSGGLLAFAGPAMVLSIPGLLVILAVGAQAFGALAWLPIARRRLGGFGLAKHPWS
jgi:hypothetical protein